MAVRDDIAFRPTDSLILRSPRRHYRTIVSPIHWQLRSIIGSDKPNVVYYPSGRFNLQIKRFSTTTNESEIIKLLTFAPRCLVAEKGWICCGGESGEFAAIRLDEDTDSSAVDLRLNLDPDARLPLELDSPRPDDGIFSILTRSRSPKSLIAKSKTFGNDRVNCITLWFRPTQMRACEGAYSQPVAVLANNDRYVTVVGLRYQDAIDTVKYPDAVNRAVISPDGRLLVGISDDPYLYIHERAVKSSDTGSCPFRPTDRPLYEWKLCRKIHLESQRLDDISDNRGSFAVCFSNTGRYLAVGTQYGTICIFNSADLTNESADPLLTSFHSARPDCEVGAVRAMAFCPGPFDLLAWTEDRGRVGIADVRGNFLSRQIISLDDDSTYEHVEVTDNGASSIDPRLLENRTAGGDGLATNLASALDLGTPPARRDDRAAADVDVGSTSMRQSVYEPARASVLDRYNHPFTADDTVVLEALQMHRRRREEQAVALRTQYPIAGAMADGMLRRGFPPSESPRGQRDVSRAVNDILVNIRDQRDRLRETVERQNRIRAQLGEDYEANRRRLNAQPAPRRGSAATPVTTTAATTATTTTGGDADALPSRRALVSRFLNNNNNNNSVSVNNGGQPSSQRAGWADIEALYNLAYESTVPSDLGTGRVEEIDMRRHDRAALVGSLLDRFQREGDEAAARRVLDTYFHSSNREAPPEDDETSGLAWSEDGRILYVGAEDGIYEFHVNVFARKMSPSITMR